MATCHIVLLPFIAYGHMIPMADMAVLFASRGLQTTIITTSSTAHRLTKSIQKTINYTHPITLHTIEFALPEEEASSLYQVIDNPDHITSNKHLSRLLEAIPSLQKPFEEFIADSKPNCIISDMFFPWTTETAAKFNIPRIAFNGTGFFYLCVSEEIRLNVNHNVLSDLEPFTVPNLPHEIKLTRKQLPLFEGEEFKFFLKVIIQAVEAEAKSYGIIVNSFYELEPGYVRHYREVMKRKAWHVGPVSLYGKSTEDKLERGKKSTIDEHECMRWLETKPASSVIYVSFGSLVKVTSSQLCEIAMALEACDTHFIWVIGNDQETFPEGFESRVQAKGRGLVIKGWAPQVLILDHVSVGGFLTHCGWNSVLEGVCGGVAMVTWPVMAEQFYNAKLVTDVLRIGISIGDVEWRVDSICDGVKREAIAKAVARVMGVEEGDDMRMRARDLQGKAKTSINKGGSSYLDLTTFIENIETFNFE